MCQCGLSSAKGQKGKVIGEKERSASDFVVFEKKIT